MASAAAAPAVLVTGANKGIGYAIATQLLQRGCRVFLGARDPSRGQAAVSTIAHALPERAAFLSYVQLDVTDDASVSAAVETVRSGLAGGELYGLVNNAGGSTGPLLNYNGHAEWEATVELNLMGTRRVTEAFLPLMSKSGGRIVLLSSGAATMFVGGCSDERKNFFRGATNPTWESIEAVVAETRALSASNPDGFETAGLSKGQPYGFAKACITLYAMDLARRFPEMKVNSCTPGLIETDLVREQAAFMGSTPEQLGCLSAEKGAQVPVMLMLDEIPTPPGEAWYYGSDGLRSPPHKYREPGSDAYDGNH